MDGIKKNGNVWTEGRATLEALGWTGLFPDENTEGWSPSLAPLAEVAGAKNLLRPWRLHQSVPGWDWFLAVENSRASQFDLLRAMSPAESAHLGSVACLALSGQGFHGQHGRSWNARKGNLHLSLLCPVDLETPSFHAALMMLPAVAALTAVRRVLGQQNAAASGQLGIKWVNDLLYGGQKLGGVLTAARTMEGRLTSVAFGIGLNVAVAPEVGADPWQTPTTSLHQVTAGAPPVLGAMAITLLAEIRRCLDQLHQQGPEVIHQAYCEGSLLVGRDIHFWPEAEVPGEEKLATPRRARVVAIGADLALHLDSGEPPLTSGRVRLVEG